MNGNTKEVANKTSDFTYSQTGYSYIDQNTINNPKQIDKIEILIKALGTMIINPSYASDPDNIGKKTFTGPIQSPMLQGESRKVAEDKLVELIKTL